jgi:hypothetical protein
VTVTPSTGSVLLGETVSFAASVSNSSDTTVIWTVNNIPGGSAQVGTVSSDGVYIAPAVLPQPDTVQVAATNHADPSKSGSATLSITSDIAISISPISSNIELGSLQTFHASITSSGHPDLAIRWSLSGASCPASCGAIDSNGIFTAPQILPSPPTVTITATSAADSTRKISASVSITSSFSLQISAPGALSTGVTAAVFATLTPVPGSDPSTSLTWILSGSGCNGSSCGVLSTATTQAIAGTAVPHAANYTAPATTPQPDTVTITVIPQADPTKKVEASILILGGSNTGLSISPIAATLAANHRTTLSVTENGIGGPLNWSVSGIASGTSAIGEICTVASNPCQPVTSSTALQVDYIAPGAIANPTRFPS